MPKQMSGATKKKKKSERNGLLNRKGGALNKYFSSTTSVDFGKNNQRQEPNPGQDDEHNRNADLEINEQSLDNYK
jgi:hypothetical protein